MKPREVLTHGEEVFERWRKTAGLVIGPVVFFVIYFIKVPALTPQAHSLFAVIGLVLVFWLTEAIPIPATALLGALMNVVLGVGSANLVLAPFAQLAAKDRADGGVGLGLPIVNSLIRLHGGALDVKSRYGRWTRISACFPKQCVVAAGPAKTAP